MQSTNEAFARVKIDALLMAQGWNVQDTNAVRFEVVMPDGTRADYVLCDRNGRALAVIEAKRFWVSPGDAAGQARQYAQQMGVPFVFLCNGAEIQFWEWEREAFPHPVKTFFKQDDLERRLASRQLRRDPRAVTIDQRIVERDYQLACIDTLCKEIAQGRRKLLVEMATGTGKTRTSAAFIKRLFEANAITRVLFLVDRIPLAKQTEDAFAEHLPDYPAYVLRAGRRFQDEKRITITTLQSMINLYADYSSAARFRRWMRSIARQLRSMSAKAPVCTSVGSAFWAWARMASMSGENPALTIAPSLASPAMRMTAVMSRLGLATCPTAAIISSGAIAASCCDMDCSAVPRAASSWMVLVARPKFLAFSSRARQRSALRMMGSRFHPSSPPNWVCRRRSTSRLVLALATTPRARVSSSGSSAPSASVAAGSSSDALGSMRSGARSRSIQVQAAWASARAIAPSKLNSTGSSTSTLSIKPKNGRTAGRALRSAEPEADETKPSGLALARAIYQDRVRNAGTTSLTLDGKQTC